MARPKKVPTEDIAPETTLLAQVKKVKTEEQETDINQMPLETLGDYVRYNKKAREMNKKLRILRYPIKQCPVELHPSQRVVFSRKDQPRNPLPVFVSNEMIHFDKKLIPGQTYDLPLCIIDHLASKGNPIWDWVTNPDGSKETRKIAMDPRFALRTIYAS